jgi:hypothetical protein
MPSNALKDDDHAGPRCATPVRPANDHRRPLCAFKTRLACGARPPLECSAKAMTRPSSTRSDAIASGCPARPVEESGGILSPSLQTNEMQGGRISFCGHCGGSLTPQLTRRGHLKRYCSDACRARAWRQSENGVTPISSPNPENPAQNTQNSGDASPGCVGEGRNRGQN